MLELLYTYVIDNQEFNTVIIDSFAGIECMNCNLLVGEEMALKILKNVAAREKYRQFLFNDEVKVTMTWGVSFSRKV